MQCRFTTGPNKVRCEREAMKGWTMCARHYSAGDSVKNDRRKKRERKEAEAKRSKR